MVSSSSSISLSSFESALATTRWKKPLISDTEKPMATKPMKLPRVSLMRRLMKKLHCPVNLLRAGALMKSPVELAAAQDQMLIDRLEALTLDRQRLALDAGDRSPERLDTAAIDREIEAVKRQRQELAARRQAQHQR